VVALLDINWEYTYDYSLINTHTFIQQLFTNFGVTVLKTNAVGKNKVLLETGD
jgi:hypothetical protein